MASKLGRPVGTASAPDRRRRGQLLKPLAGRSDLTPWSLEHFVWWCETYLVQSIDQWAGEPLVFESWQVEWLEAALARDPDGAARWASIALIVSRKNGKSTMLAALALYSLLEGEGQPEILLAAASDKQAGRMFDTVVSYIRRNPELDARCHLREYVGEISRVDGGGKIFRMANDPSTLQGYNPSLVICDELAFWTKPGHRKAWAALTTGGGARRLTQVVTITTAGNAEDREDSILGGMVDKNELHGHVEHRPGLTISRNAEARTIVWNYSAPTRDPLDVKAMKLANPASWITEEYLARQAANPELAPFEVLQMHGCVWAEGIGTWITADRWAECFDSREIPKGASIVAGVDAAHVRDTTACTITWTAPDGRQVQKTRVWSCIQGKPHHVFVPGGRLDNDLVVDYIRDVLMRDFDLRMVIFDERYFTDQAHRLGEDDDLPVVEMTQSVSEMRQAWSLYYDAIHMGEKPTLAHDGDAVYAAHVRNCVARKRDEGSWHVSKAAAERPIDAVAAGAMSLYGAVFLLEEPVETMFAFS